jgi:hypothetical protein
MDFARTLDRAIEEQRATIRSGYDELQRRIYAKAAAEGCEAPSVEDVMLGRARWGSLTGTFSAEMAKQHVIKSRRRSTSNRRVKQNRLSSEVVDMDHRVHELRAIGYTYREIAALVGVSHGKVGNILNKRDTVRG